MIQIVLGCPPKLQNVNFMSLTRQFRTIVTHRARPFNAAVSGLRKCEAGFTLLEMLVALGIFALALGVSTVALRGPDGSKRLRILTLSVAADMRLARANAVLLHRPVTVLLVPNDNMYSVDDRRTPVRLPSSVKLAVSSGAKGASRDGSAGITFYSDGSSSGGHVSLTEGVATTRITIDFLTGAVAVTGQSP